MSIPNLAGVATAGLVENIGGGKFSASYINWSRTLHLLREHAPGWLPELVETSDGGVLHRSPVGGFLLLRFVNLDTGAVTPPVPQAVMDHSNKSIPFDKISARDVTDTHRRGACMAAALTFGLAYELWAKIPLESGYGEQAEAPAKPSAKVTPLDGVWDALSDEEREFIEAQAATVRQAFEDGGAEVAAALIYRDLNLTQDEVLALWTRLPSNIRNQSKKFKDQFTAKPEAA